MLRYKFPCSATGWTRECIFQLWARSKFHSNLLGDCITFHHGNCESGLESDRGRHGQFSRLNSCKYFLGVPEMDTPKPLVSILNLSNFGCFVPPFRTSPYGYGSESNPCYPGSKSKKLAHGCSCPQRNDNHWVVTPPHFQRWWWQVDKRLIKGEHCTAALWFCSFISMGWWPHSISLVEMGWTHRVPCVAGISFTRSIPSCLGWWVTRTNIMIRKYIMSRGWHITSFWNNMLMITCWWFGTFLFFHILGIVIPSGSYVSKGLKPPTRLMFKSHVNDWLMAEFSFLGEWWLHMTVKLLAAVFKM